MGGGNGSERRQHDCDKTPFHFTPQTSFAKFLEFHIRNLASVPK
jgi:hypothetical protein